MYDAIGLTIDRMQKEIPDIDDPNVAVLFLIITDGHENSSRTISGTMIGEIIKSLNKNMNQQKWKALVIIVILMVIAVAVVAVYNNRAKKVPVTQKPPAQQVRHESASGALSASRRADQDDVYAVRRHNRASTRRR